MGSQPRPQHAISAPAGSPGQEPLPSSPLPAHPHAPACPACLGGVLPLQRLEYLQLHHGGVAVLLRYGTTGYGTAGYSRLQLTAGCDAMTDVLVPMQCVLGCMPRHRAGERRPSEPTGGPAQLGREGGQEQESSARHGGRALKRKGAHQSCAPARKASPVCVLRLGLAPNLAAPDLDDSG